MANDVPDYASIQSLADLRAHLGCEDETLRLFEWLRWPNGRVCPQCGSVGKHYQIKKISRRKKPRIGFYDCADCRTRFSATAGTPLHGTKLPLSVWIEAGFLVAASSKGVSSITLHKHLGISQKTAWKMAHALRLLMEPPSDEPKLSGIVESDNLADGQKAQRRNRRKYGSKIAKHIYNPPGRGSPKTRILVATERGGRARAAIMPDGSAKTVAPLMASMVSKGAHLMTDGDLTLGAVGKEHDDHSAVNHSAKEYARGNVHTNTAEGFNLFIRRAKMGVWHKWDEEHIPRYLSELQFHWDHRPKLDRVVGVRHNQVRATSAIRKMREMFARCDGRQLRRSTDGGLCSPGDPAHRVQPNPRSPDQDIEDARNAF